MKQFDYLIIGGGMAGSAAATAIRERDADGSLGIISQESTPPYDRPPLSKGLWLGEANQEEILREVPDNTELIQACVITKLRPEEQQVVDEEGNVYTYGRLLLATGGTPKRLPFDDDEQILYYRTLNDYRRLEQLTEQYNQFAVIGGGFIGSEIAAALAQNGKDVTLIFPEPGIGAFIFPEDLSGFLNRAYESKGVALLAGEQIQSMQGHVGNFRLEMESGLEIDADVIVAGIGIEINTTLADAAGLKQTDGIWVDEYLRTSDPNIYAAGDIVSFFDPVVGQRRRVEHEDNALTMGETAGRNMASAAEPYEHSPYFYSDLFDWGYEAVGKLDSNLKTVADWQEEYEKGVIYYLKEDRIRGVLLWNVWDEIEAARDLIAKKESFHPDSVRGLIGAWGALNETLEESFPASDPPANW